MVALNRSKLFKPRKQVGPGAHAKTIIFLPVKAIRYVPLNAPIKTLNFWSLFSRDLAKSLAGVMYALYTGPA